jgi:undecaprenyl-diphosphatase
VSFGLASLASTGLKLLVDRERPDGQRLVELPDTSSFPSGHASTSFGAAVALSLLAPRAALWALPLAALIAFSRVHLGVHYWEDILAGALLGTLVAVGVVRLRRSALAARR